MTTRETSAKPEFPFRRLWLTTGWMLVLLVVYLSLTPRPPPLTATQGDKLEHILAYAVLMSWFANLHAGMAQRMRIAAGLIALGVGLEFVQRWSGHRTFETADMAADAVGVVAGWLCAPPRLPDYLLWIEKFLGGLAPKPRD